MFYEAGKTRAEPHTKIVEKLPGMRRDSEELVKNAIGENLLPYALINICSEEHTELGSNHRTHLADPDLRLIDHWVPSRVMT